MDFLKRLVTWWNGQTLGTQLYTSRKGVKVGEDGVAARGAITRSRPSPRYWAMWPAYCRMTAAAARAIDGDGDQCARSYLHPQRPAIRHRAVRHRRAVLEHRARAAQGQGAAGRIGLDVCGPARLSEGSHYPTDVMAGRRPGHYKCFFGGPASVLLCRALGRSELGLEVLFELDQVLWQRHAEGAEKSSHLTFLPWAGSPPRSP